MYYVIFVASNAVADDEADLADLVRDPKIVEDDDDSSEYVVFGFLKIIWKNSYSTSARIEMSKRRPKLPTPTTTTTKRTRAPVSLLRVAIVSHSFYIFYLKKLFSS